MKASEVIESLKRVLGNLDSDDMSIEAPFIEEAMRCVGLCLACKGRGVLHFTNHAKPGVYKVRELRGGGILYEYDCWFCEGKGQRLKGKCSSCLADYDMGSRVRLTQLEMIFLDSMCDACFAGRDAKTGLIPLPQPKDETKKLDPIMNENSGLKKKGKR